MRNIFYWSIVFDCVLSSSEAESVQVAFDEKFVATGPIKDLEESNKGKDLSSHALIWVGYFRNRIRVTPADCIDYLAASQDSIALDQLKARRTA
jgi:hypothetical protein